MSIIFKTGGYGGSGSSSDNSAQTLYVPDEYVFTSATTIAEAQAARDAYFIAHPTELNKAVVITKTDDNSQVLMEKYDNGVWVDITTVIKGPKGDTGDTGAAGVNGTNGINGTNGTDGKDLNWCGEWVSTTAYLPVDGVRFNGSSYYCLVANTGKEPSINATEWGLACSKGLDGADGAGYVSKGGYNASTTYDIGSVVTYEGSSYACIKEPALDKMPTDSSYWVIVAKKGDTGISGLTAKGAYSGLIAYSVNDVVEYLGSAYVCYVASQGVLPTDTTKWAILVTKGAAGDQGPKGDTGASIVWKGDYATGTAYAVNDVVIYEGSAWVCVGTSTGNAPSASSSYWDMMCSKGDSVALVDKSTWAAGTVYTSGDVVMHVSLILVCVESHTASTNFDDDAAKWVTTGVGAILSDSGAEWVSGTVYPLQVMVTHAGYKWTCIAEHESAATWELDSEWWAKIGVAESLTDGGAWAASTHYNLGAVVTKDGNKYVSLLDHTSASTFSLDSSNWIFIGISGNSFGGATSLIDGIAGTVPAPLASQQNSHLAGDGTWDPVLYRAVVTLSNISSNSSLTASTSVDIAEVIAIPQTTTGITITIPNPTVTSRVRKVLIINTGTIGFYLSTGQLVVPGKWVELYWSIALAGWESNVGETKAYSQTTAYQAFDRVVMGTVEAYANSSIPANTVFQWGSSGATWSPVLPGHLSWSGIWTSGNVYGPLSVFTNSVGFMSDFFVVATGSSYAAGVTSLIADLTTDGSASTGNVQRVGFGVSSSDSVYKNFIGSSSTVAGISGTVPTPVIGTQDATLMGSGVWDKTGRGTVVTLTSQATATLVASTTVDVCEFLDISTSAASQVITLPTPTTTTKSRVLKILNGGSYQFTCNSKVVPVSGCVMFSWSPTKVAWEPNSSVFVDSDLSIVDNSDVTKVAQFEASGITTATTRTYTLPNASGTVSINANPANFTPATTATYTLGTSSLVWSAAYTNTITSATSTALTLNATATQGNLQVAGTSYYKWTSTAFSPSTTNVYTLGSSSIVWSNTYTNTVTSSSASSLTLNAGVTSGIMQVAGTNYYAWTVTAFYPLITATYSLGTSAYAWYNTYTNSVTSAASTALTLNGTATGGNLQVAGTTYYSWSVTALSPATTASYNLGTSSLVWSTAYANTVTSAASTSLTLNATSTGGKLQVAGTTYYNWSSTSFSPNADNAYTLGVSGTSFSTTYTRAISSGLAGTPINIVDPTTSTKIASLDVSGITAGNTRAFVFPDAGGTIGLKTGLAQYYLTSSVTPATSTAVGPWTSLYNDCSASMSGNYLMLAANKRYKLTAKLHASCSAAGEIQYRWYYSSSATVGTAFGIAAFDKTLTSTSNETTVNTAIGIIKTTAVTYVAIVPIGLTNVSSVLGGNGYLTTYIEVEEMSI
jgi:hypothetical protein